MDYSQKTDVGCPSLDSVYPREGGSGLCEKKGAVDEETTEAEGSDTERDEELEEYPGRYFSLQARWMVQPMSQQYLSETIPGHFLSLQSKRLLRSTV